ncbi:hypothetical protein P618_201103 [Holospora obtusa F1]|uniref:Uncharacterized protein n=1 Tax=Holospora obtusa F1 TaxID=1399147 RepID=W6TDQ3_HOLOB|nr:hypothetical protein P618_201103 [Holospora obtusa F1]
MDVERWADLGLSTQIQERLVKPGKKSDEVYCGASSIFHGSNIRAGHMDIRAQSFASQGCHIEGSGSITVRALQHRPGVNTFLESSTLSIFKKPGRARLRCRGPLRGDLKVSMGQGSFQATEFRSGVSLEAAEKLQLMAAPVQDSYHKTQVLKKNIVRIKTQSLAGQGLSYRNCGVHGVLRVDTPLLEMSAQGSPPALEIAPRESFCQVLQVLEPCIQEATHISTQFKPAFKAVLGVGITALSAVLAPPLVGSVIAASGHAFIQNSGLECLADHRHIHFREMLKDAGKSLAVSGAGLALGEILPDHRAIHAVKNTALNCAVYQADPLKALAGQGLVQVSGFLAGQIGLEYQSKELNFLEHKLLHGALSLASTLSLQAINSGHLDWSRAFLAAGATMAAESGAELVMENVKQFLPKQLPQEPWSDYVARCQEAGLELGRRTQACIRVLTAAGLCLAGKDSGDIIACDTASSNALEHNFLASIPAIVLDVVQGAKDIKENLEAGNYWTAGGHAALTAGSVALDLASSGLGTQGLKAGARAAKAGVRLAKKAFSKEQKGPNTLMKTETRNDGGSQAKRGSQAENVSARKNIEKSSKMIPEEMRVYAEKYQGEGLCVGKYDDAHVKEFITKKKIETGLEFEKHHIYPQAQAKEFRKQTGKEFRNDVVIAMPAGMHQGKGRKLIHKHNEKIKHGHDRSGLAQGIIDTRKGLQEAGFHQDVVNDVCSQALRMTKESAPNNFLERLPCKPKGD